MNRAWIQAQCSTEEYRANLRQPFGVTLNDARWICASDGRRLVIVPGEEPERHNAPPVNSVARWLFDDAGARECRLDSLRAWCREGLTALPPPDSPCQTCKGKKVTKCGACHGDGTCSCYRCDADHDCGQCDGDGETKCEDCEGTGTIGEHAEKESLHPGQIVKGVGVDRRMFLDLLDGAPGETVAIAARRPSDPFTVRGDGWRAIVMPMRLDDETAPVFVEWLP